MRKTINLSKIPPCPTEQDYDKAIIWAKEVKYNEGIKLKLPDDNKVAFAWTTGPRARFNNATLSVDNTLGNFTANKPVNSSTKNIYIIMGYRSFSVLWGKDKKHGTCDFELVNLAEFLRFYKKKYNVHILEKGIVYKDIQKLIIDRLPENINAYRQENIVFYIEDAYRQGIEVEVAYVRNFTIEQ